jgi:hypothetical protein
MERFVLVGADATGRAKVCDRAAVNPALAREAAHDVARFGAQLTTRFNLPHTDGTTRVAVCVRDTSTGLDFEAFAAPSGPAYGYAAARAEPLNSAAPPTDDLMLVLAAFDAWLVAGEFASRLD